MYELFLKGGLVMWPLLGLSVLALALIAQRFCLLLALKRGNGVPTTQAELAGRIQRGIEHIFFISSVAPTFGLLGTVLGIIKSFTVLSMARPDPQILSQGLSEALFTTAAGLAIALPCQIAGHFLQQSLDGALAEQQQLNTARAEGETPPPPDRAL